MYFPFRAPAAYFSEGKLSVFRGVQHAMKKRLLEIYNKYISWVWPLPRMPVTTRIIYYIFSRESLETFIGHCSWEGATPNI